MKKKVLVLDGNKKFFLGGGQKVTLSVMEILSEGYEITLFETEKTDEFFRRAVHLNAQVFRLEENENKCGIKKFIKACQLMKKQDLNADETIIYSASKLSHLYCILFRLAGYRTIMHVHSVNSKSSPLFYLMKFSFFFSDEVIVTSEFVAKFFSLKKFTLLYNYVDIPRSSPAVIKKPFIVAYVGSVENFKGVDVFCKASLQFKNAENIEFAIFGKGSEEQKIARDFPHIKMYGFIDNVQDILSEKVSLLVLPTKIPEAFGLVLAEAVSCNVPVVVSDQGAQKEIASLFQTRGFFKNADANSLSEEINYFLNEDHYRKQQKKLPEWKNYFSKELFKKNLLGLFNTHSYSQTPSRKSGR